MLGFETKPTMNRINSKIPEIIKLKND